MPEVIWKANERTAGFAVNGGDDDRVLERGAYLVVEPGFDADIEELYGKEFVPYLTAKPYSAFFANGSDVSVRIGEKIDERRQ